MGIKQVSAPQDAVSAEILQSGNLVYAVTSGSASAYTLNLTPALAAYTSGMEIRFKAHVANAAGITLEIDGHGALPIKKDVSNNLSAGDLQNGQLVTVAYDAGNNAFQLLSRIADANSGGTVTSVSGTVPVVSSGGNNPNISIPVATASVDGYLSATDWSSFNAKEPAIAAGAASQYWRGDKTWQTLNTTAVPEGTNLYYTNTRGIGSVLTGFSSAAGTVTASDNILQAIQKLNGNIGAIVSGVSSVNGLTGAVPLTGTANRITVSPANVFDISANYVGQSSITTLGTIATGTWNATTIGVTKGGTGTSTAFTQGSIVFAGTGGVYTQDITAGGQLFWDATNHRLGIGTNTPSASLDVNGAIAGWGIVPIGTVVAWLKSSTGTPALPTGWVECGGQTLSDGASPYNGQAIPNLNGGNQFLRGNTTSSGTGGAATHAHSVTTTQTGSDLAPDASHFVDGTIITVNAASSLPPYRDVVWIMRVK